MPNPETRSHGCAEVCCTVSQSFGLLDFFVELLMGISTSRTSANCSISGRALSSSLAFSWADLGAIPLWTYTEYHNVLGPKTEPISLYDESRKIQSFSSAAVCHRPLRSPASLSTFFRTVAHLPSKDSSIATIRLAFLIYRVLNARRVNHGRPGEEMMMITAESSLFLTSQTSHTLFLVPTTRTAICTLFLLTDGHQK